MLASTGLKYLFFFEKIDNNFINYFDNILIYILSATNGYESRIKSMAS